jgi:hypothetical protein
MNSKLVWLDKFKDEKNINLIKLLLFFIVIFTSSINLFYKISLNGAYVRGLLVDYLIPKIYLTELFLIPFLIIEFKQLKKIKLATYLGFLLLVLLTRQLFNQNILAALTYLIHFTEIVLFLSVVKRDPLFKTKISKKFALGAMFATILFQSLLAIYQFIFQKSLLKYQILAETNLKDLTNISRAQFFFGEKILPYGTTAHPNILAGVIVIFSILIIKQIKNKDSKKTIIALLANALLIIYLTQSLTALLTLGLFSLYLLLNKIKKHRAVVICVVYYFFILFLPFFLTQMTSDQNHSSIDSIKRRVTLNQAALTMFEKNMISGVGINNFTLELENYTSNSTYKEIVRFVQPVHNLLFLVLSEGGLLGLTVLLLIIKQLNIEHFYSKSMILLAIISLDHYLLTQFAGLSLLALFYLFI